MTTVFDTYSPELMQHLSRGFSFASAGKRLRIAGLHDRSELHDVVAETFRRAFEERARLGYGALAPYRAYLKTIARNLLLDRYRGCSTVTLTSIDQQHAEQHADEVATACDSPSAQQSLERAELSLLVRSFVADLDKRARRFVELRYEQGLAQQDVAARMGVSRRRVRKLERQVRAAMVDSLRGTGYLGSGEQGEPSSSGDRR